MRETDDAEAIHFFCLKRYIFEELAKIKGANSTPLTSLVWICNPHPLALDFQSNHSATIHFPICEACINAGEEVIDHFPDVRKTIPMQEQLKKRLLMDMNTMP